MTKRINFNCFVSLKRFLTSLIILSSFVLFAILGKYIGFLVHGEGTMVCMGIDSLGVCMGVGILDLCGLVNRSFNRR